MDDIIPRDVLCSNKKMWDKMEELKAVIFATKTMKKIVKKQTIEYQVPKFKTDKEVVDRIVRSAEYYKDLYLNEQIEKDRIEENLVFTLPGRFTSLNSTPLSGGIASKSGIPFLLVRMSLIT